MKKIISLIIGCLLIISIIGDIATAKAGAAAKDEQNLKSIEQKLIRFHVIANSDSAEDQALKLKVRDKILEYISPKLKNSKNIDESRNILKENDAQIIKIAQDTIKKNGFKYAVKTELSKENFPVKTYGNITLPPGEYEAYRIIIGSGSGQNWWCVMFPPLCFVDITRGEVSRKETEKTMKNVLTDEEYNFVDNTSQVETKVQVKFKIVEIFKSVFGI